MRRLIALLIPVTGIVGACAPAERTAEEGSEAAEEEATKEAMRSAWDALVTRSDEAERFVQGLPRNETPVMLEGQNDEGWGEFVERAPPPYPDGLTDVGTGWPGAELSRMLSRMYSGDLETSAGEGIFEEKSGDERVRRHGAVSTCKDGQPSIAYGDPPMYDEITDVALLFIREHEAGHHDAGHVDCDAERKQVPDGGEHDADCYAVTRMYDRGPVGIWIVASWVTTLGLLDLDAPDGQPSTIERAQHIQNGLCGSPLPVDDP